MKESIGNAFVFGVFILFAFLTIIILSSAISYSRASKIKNRLVTFIQNYAESYSDGKSDESIFLNNDEFSNYVNDLLSKAGYRMKDYYYSNNCEKYRKNATEVMDISNSPYDFCVYSFATERGYYYKVVTYMYFDLPIIGQTLKFPISGSTRVIYNLNDK